MIHRWSLTRLVRELRAGAVSPVDVVEDYLRRIEEANPAINAFVEVRAEEALAQAKRLVEQPREDRGPLWGVPVTIKDSLDLAGSPTLCGSRLRQTHRAAHDSTPAARLRAAGAIPIGKTNCPEFLWNWETDNAVTGRTNHPLNAEFTAGGSSGGESAAIAAFCSAGGVGSDGGGSIRIPAHFCGICGLKPTPGRVPAAGHFPEIGHPGGLLGVVGPMARTARDLQVLFETLAGHDDQDPFSAPVPVRAAALDGIRIGVVESMGHVPVDSAVGSAVRSAAAALGRLGFPVERFAPHGLDQARENWWFFFCELPAPLVRAMIRGREGQIHWTGLELLGMVDPAQSISGQMVLEQLARRDRMRASLLRQMKDHQVLLLPPCAVPAFHHRQREWVVNGRTLSLLDIMQYAYPFNLLGFPALVLPFGVTPEGMPIGVQLVGRPYEEEVLIELAIRLADSAAPLLREPA